MKQSMWSDQGPSQPAVVPAELVDARQAAIKAFTDAARVNEWRGTRTDMAEFVAHVVTAAAANTGGLDVFLSGRSGSWEADLVRQLVEGTAGADGVGLDELRTVPFRLVLDPEYILNDVGLERLVDEETQPLVEERNRLYDTVADLYTAAPADHPDPVIREAIAAGIPARVPWTGLTDAEQARIDDVDAAAASLEEREMAMWSLFVADRLQFARDLAATAEQVLGEENQPPHDVLIDVVIGSGEWEWHPLTEALEDKIRARVAAPVLARPLGEVHGLTDAIRQAGRSYAERVLAGERAELLEVGTDVVTPGGRRGTVAEIVDDTPFRTVRVRIDEVHVRADEFNPVEYREWELTPDGRVEDEDMAEIQQEIRDRQAAMTCPQCGSAGRPAQFRDAPADTPVNDGGAWLESNDGLTICDQCGHRWSASS